MSSKRDFRAKLRTSGAPDSLAGTGTEDAFALKVKNAQQDTVDHPPHYNQGNVECIEALEAIGIAKHYCQGNAIKYLWRLDAKGKSLEDAKKAQWYVNRLVGILEEENESP